MRPSWRCVCCARRAHARGRQPDRVEDLRVAGAAAEVAGELLADLVVPRARHALEQRRGRDDEARRAEAALHRPRLDERLLDAVQPVLAAQPLDRRHLVAVRLRRQDEARAHELAVEQHRARAALALLARVLRAGQPERVAQRVSRLSPAQTSASRGSPLTISLIFMRAPGPARAWSAPRSAWRR